MHTGAHLLCIARCWLAISKSLCQGRKSAISVEMMLRIHLLQQWFTLSEPLMEEILIDTPSFRRFAGIGMVCERIPDKTTILNFRHLLMLKQHGIGDQIVEAIKQALRDQGALLQEDRPGYYQFKQEQ